VEERARRQFVLELLTKDSGSYTNELGLCNF
jgi:hypothetical protein